MIHYGTTLKKHAEEDALKYLNFPKELLENSTMFSELMSKFGSLTSNNDTIIISNEAWTDKGAVSQGVIETLGNVRCQIDVFMVCRPPVDWFNAAWWQWGAWVGDQEKASLLKSYQEINFWSSVQEWQRTGLINQIKIVDLSQDPLTSFLQFAGVVTDQPIRFTPSNSATDYDVLRHLIHNKEHYRRSIHNPGIEFYLNRLLKFKPRRPPGYASRAIAEAIIENSRADHERLIEMIEQTGQKLDPEVVRKYLDASSYKDLPEETLALPSQPDYSDAFVLNLVDTIISLGKEIDALRR